MKKIKLHVIGRLSGDYIVQEVTGELFQGEPDEMGALAIVHLVKGKNNILRASSEWQMINIYTGMLVVRGKTRKDCVAEYETHRERYEKILKNTKFMEDQKRRLDDLLAAQ